MSEHNHNQQHNHEHAAHEAAVATQATTHTPATTETPAAGTPVTIDLPDGYVPTTKVIRFRQVEKGGVKIKREPITLTYPIPSIDAVVEALSNDKQREFILDLISDAIYSAVRDQTDDAENPVNFQADLDFSKLSVAYLSSIEKAARGGSGIAPELWEAFVKDYAATVPKYNPQRSASKIAAAGVILGKKLAPVRNAAPDVLDFFTRELDRWAEHTENLEGFEVIYSALKAKLANYQEVEAKDLLSELN